MCCCKFGQSPCMTYLYGCQEYLKDTVEHDLFSDATWCVGLQDPAMYSTQCHRKTWHAQFCCTTRGIDPYVLAYTTQLYMCQGTRYPICGYQSAKREDLSLSKEFLLNLVCPCNNFSMHLYYQFMCFSSCYLTNWWWPTQHILIYIVNLSIMQRTWLVSSLIPRK